MMRAAAIRNKMGGVCMGLHPARLLKLLLKTVIHRLASVTMLWIGETTQTIAAQATVATQLIPLVLLGPCCKIPRIALRGANLHIQDPTHISISQTMVVGRNAAVAPER